MKVKDYYYSEIIRMNNEERRPKAVELEETFNLEVGKMYLRTNYGIFNQTEVVQVVSEYKFLKVDTEDITVTFSLSNLTDKSNLFELPEDCQSDLAPEGYEFTGEYEMPWYGQIYLDDAGKVQSQFAGSLKKRRHTLRKIEKWRPAEWPKDHGKRCRYGDSLNFTGQIVGYMPDESVYKTIIKNSQAILNRWNINNVEVLDDN